MRSAKVRQSGGTDVKNNLWKFAVSCILSSAILASSQTATTSLRGVIKDPSGALVPSATITLANKTNGSTLTSTSDSIGFYIFPQIPPARYSITVSASGFSDQTKTAQLLVNQPASIDFTLTLGANAVTVDVSASAEALNLTDATIGNAVGNTTIEALPMEGRNPASLLSLQPGVLFIGQNDSTQADSRQGSVAGGRSDQGNVTLDGVDDNDQINGYAFKGILRSTLDSTEEFRVTTSNGTAATGRSSGAQVDLVTKSGTNARHGSLYEYYRPTNTVANAFFLKNSQLSAGDPNVPQKYVQNVFGGSFGGPVLKDKLFYFFNYEGLRRAIDDIVQATVPTASFMAGNLTYADVNGGVSTVTPAQVAKLDAACATNTFNGKSVCPWGPGVDPNVLSYYSKVPVATGNAAGDGGYNSGSLFFPSPAPHTENTSILKIDYRMNNQHSFFVRGNLQKDTTAGNANLPGQPASSFTTDNTKGIAFGDTWTPTDHIVNDIRYGFVRQGYQTSGLGTGDYVFFRYLTQPTAQTRNTTLHVPVHNIVDTFTFTKGAHTINLGGNWRGITDQHGTDANSFNNANTNPTWLGGTPPDPSTLSGLPAVASGFGSSWINAYSTLVGNIPELTNIYNFKVDSAAGGTALPDGAFINRNFRSNEFEYYLQDTWRARPNLTVTIGLRHTLLQTPYETNGQQVSPTVDTDAWYKGREAAALKGQISEPLLSFAPSGKANGKPGFWPKQKLNLAPRLGVVFAPDAKTSVRAGAGLYFDHYGEGLVSSFDQEGSFGLSAELNNPASTYGMETSPRFTGVRNLPAIPLPAATAKQTFPYTPPDGNFGIAWGMNNHLKTPYSESFNLSIQRELPAGFVLETAYVGRLGRHLLEQLDLAQPVDYNDPQGGGDYYSAASKLSAIVDANGSCIPGNNCTVPNVAAIPYFENVFPYMKNFDGPGESATQAIYNNEWATNRDNLGETSALADLDFFCSNYFDPTIGYNCPAQSRFWQSQFSSLYAWDTIGTSSYNALQFTLRHATSHGLSVDVNYTYSKSIDMNSGTERNNELTPTSSGLVSDSGFAGTGIQNTWNPKLNKGVSDFDTRHLITADWVYSLPVGRGKYLLGNANRVVEAVAGGWQFAGLGRWTSALPFSIQEYGYTTDWQLEGFSVVTAPVKIRKHLDTGGIPQIFDDPDSINNGYANGNPIRAPYPGEAGQRNAFRGDGYFDIDSSLTKSWNLHDKARLKFVGEAYNVGNNVRFDCSPNGLNAVLSQGSLGSYDAPLGLYRRMEFGLRLDF
jgi:hypothetical protein